MAYHHGDLRDTILNMADEIVREAGIDKLSVRACAKRAGVSVTAPLHHFPNAKALVTALAVRGFKGLLEMVDTVKQREGLPDGTQLAIQAYAEFGQSRSGYFSFMFRDTLLNADDPELAAARTATFARLVTMATSDPEMSVSADSREGNLMILKTWIIAHGLSALLAESKVLSQLGGSEPGFGSLEDIIALVASHEFMGFMPKRRTLG